MINDIVYTKVVNEFGEEFLLVYNRGDISTPLLCLNKQLIENLNKEWKKPIKLSK